MAAHLYTHTSALQHDTGSRHPENMRRITRIHEIFRHAPYNHWPQYWDMESGSLNHICLAHSRDYHDWLAHHVPERATRPINPDTLIGPESMIAAHDAVGCVRQAVRDVCQHETKRAFCAVRPPGHHAMPDDSMGFCLFNNIFIGARLIQENYGYQRIGIVDFDVHHGNGTEAMTQGAENILYISSHQWPFYPGTGAPDDQVPGRIVNGTLSEGAKGDDFRALYNDHLLPALDDFQPEILLISAGFDAHERDPLGGLNLTGDDFSWITQQLVRVADKHCDGRIVSVLEGGYDLDGLEDGLCAHLNALQQQETT